MLALLLALSCGYAQEEAQEEAKPAAMAKPKTDIKLETEMDKVSYAIGVQIGTSLRMQKVDVNTKILFSALDAAVKDEPLLMTEEEMIQVMEAFQQKMEQKMQEMQQQEGAGNEKAAKEFLAENAKKEGVKITDSGLQYQVLEEGKGASPTAKDKVQCHYRGTFLDGEEFDSSYKRGEPTTFGVTQVIKGWTEALQMMKEGDKWKLWIPADLAYGEGRSGIPPNSLLIFEIELIKVNPEQ
ncbi:FKBP-type peptidyl-prolyl cis-trans isomerase [bacterium]|nr:FKBP-type peptidyl-prolyl cis-trans isomerase [bacterium]